MYGGGEKDHAKCTSLLRSLKSPENMLNAEAAVHSGEEYSGNHI